MSVFKKLFRPGSGGAQKGISIVDTQHGRAAIRNPITDRVREQESDPESTFYPLILTNELTAFGSEIPRGTLPGVDKEGNIPRYEPDDPQVLRRIFGVEMADE